MPEPGWRSLADNRGRPGLRRVDKEPRMRAKAPAPARLRKQPETFCCTLNGLVLPSVLDFSSRDQETPAYTVWHRETAALRGALLSPLDRPARPGSESTRCCP